MELQISETKEELLLNTINYFNSNNRQINDDYSFAYINKETGDRSPIGRELPESLATHINGSVSNWDVYNKLPNRLKKMGIEFLRDIQVLHDSGIYWDDDGLSESGRNRVRNIIKRYNLDLEL